ncbi:hypothetical protein HMPREF0322_03184 [Desulfitobacterium hafniense DP7]|uniref:Uncharacterized protein n=1 Tax=Desulfitobacterium hafniense DP7 TaxID=537010 RepID=G9XQD7_DESHA|nr:hypothetical protein HMPREF0322_03184 [Desulfitobacterium hafniense DP7]
MAQKAGLIKLSQQVFIAPSINLVCAEKVCPTHYRSKSLRLLK